MGLGGSWALRLCDTLDAATAAAKGLCAALDAAKAAAKGPCDWASPGMGLRCEGMAPGAMVRGALGGGVHLLRGRKVSTMGTKGESTGRCWENWRKA